jgi:hypothetical protein
MLPRITRTEEERFWEKVHKTEGCWVWSAAKLPTGYGVFVSDSGRYAHRWSYEKHHGPIPDGMEIDHKCHNRSCVRPDHLQAASKKHNLENMRGAHRGNRSGARGVSWDAKSQKWSVRVYHHGIRHYGGLHEDIDVAAEVARDLRNELYVNNLADRRASHD